MSSARPSSLNGARRSVFVGERRLSSMPLWGKGDRHLFAVFRWMIVNATEEKGDRHLFLRISWMFANSAKKGASPLFLAIRTAGVK